MRISATVEKATAATAIALILGIGTPAVEGQTEIGNTLPIRGFAIGAPAPDRVDDFVEFIQKELAPNNVNTLVVRIDYSYEYRSHPELRDDDPLSRKDVRKILKACRRGGIRVIPQVNLLGHQSWEDEHTKLLEVYPQFDETPWIDLPEKFVWPNPDGLYCKSYCPLHPEVHTVIFDVVDEIIEVFEADTFHAGMDEVFYIGTVSCPRCGGRDPAELFAGEVTRIRNHLAERGIELWIWGDRLIDGKTTGIGEWEASMNNTHRAIDLIPKDVVINDWHYERVDPTAPYFAAKGFTVVTCPWKLGEVAKEQIEDMLRFRGGSTPVMTPRFAGVMQTIWSPAGEFLDRYWDRVEKVENDQGGDPIECTKRVFEMFQAMDR